MAKAVHNQSTSFVAAPPSTGETSPITTLFQPATYALIRSVSTLRQVHLMAEAQATGERFLTIVESRHYGTAVIVLIGFQR